ncbi:right-handed parallel beta-helix repeat-containing protein [uncultured Victivallis sp.]|uniref:right-handed parallel beta-helix repeat-containing protein n=1 Tax=uncultured Victivallis sp. TaxID=354118 RepID=UPI0025CE3400|nr:right-handed parallel beta-helix repeat-containing protein [uncultured Victivallis sp.]
MKKTALLFTLFCTVLLTAEAGTTLRLVPLFRGCSYYWRGEASGTVTPFFRAIDSTRWSAGIPPVHDRDRKEYRGSIVHLEEDRAYEFELRDAKGKLLPGSRGTFRTWKSAVPVARTVVLDESNFDGHLEITAKGRPDGWIRYTAKPGFVLTNPRQAANKEKTVAHDNSDAMINLRNAEYILIDNLTVRGGMSHVIHVENSSHIRIANCDIAGWGRVGVQRFDRNGRFFPVGVPVPEDYYGINFDAAIHLKNSANVVIERNYIHDPLSRANSWLYAHPAGPEAVAVQMVRNTVLRYNDFIGSDEHRFNDAVEGMGNFHPQGGFNTDAEIYGNFMIFCNDDNIELDGGQQNVRCFRNRFEGALCGVSIQGCMTGPSYLYENLTSEMGDEQGTTQLILKTASRRSGKYAASYVFNNTFSGKGKGTDVLEHHRLILYNNIFDGAGNRIAHADRPTAELACNLLPDGPAPRFLDAARGRYELAADSPARGRGKEIPNFTGPGPVDIGAFQSASPAPLPERPLPVRLDCGKIRFKAGETFAKVTAKGTGSGFSGRYRIAKNHDFDWFTVTPDSGTLKSGDQVTFTIQTRPERFRERPLMHGAFLIRFEDGLSRPVSVYAETGWEMPLKPHKPGDVAIYLNPEKADKKKKFPRVDPARGPEEDGCVEFPARARPEQAGSPYLLEFEFEVPKEGYYGLFVRADVPSPAGAHDSFFYAFDDQPMIFGGFAEARSGRKRWYMVGQSSGHQETRSAFHLTRGRHKLRISPRESTRIGLIAVTDNHYAFELRE